MLPLRGNKKKHSLKYSQHSLATGSVPWRRSGLMVSVLDVQSGGCSFEPGLCRRVVSLDKKLSFTLSLFTQVYKWVPAIIILGGY